MLVFDVVAEAALVAEAVPDGALEVPATDVVAEEPPQLAKATAAQTVSRPVAPERGIALRIERWEVT